MKNLKNIGKALSREELKNISGGIISNFESYTSIDYVSGDICKAICNDGSIVNVSGCSDASYVCSNRKGVKSCDCGYKSPLDPPSFSITLF